MSRKSECESAHEWYVFEPNEELVSVLPAYTQPPAVELPNFNQEMLTDAAREKEPEAGYMLCKHLVESRKNHTDFYGYFEKGLVKQDGKTLGVSFVKWCHECASRVTSGEERKGIRVEVLARVAFCRLSDHTLKTMLKNGATMSNSKRGERLAAEAAAEGTDTIN